MKLSTALTKHPDVKILRIDDSEELDFDRFADWRVDPVTGGVLEMDSGFFLLQALQILDSGDEVGCYIDLTMPERIPDHVYFVQSGVIGRQYIHECDGEVICTVPIDGFGQYDLYYSRTKPEVGISVLRRGLDLAARKGFIAEDLGYILRDEERFEEAIDAFRISATGEPSSDFVYLELAGLYDQIGRSDLAEEYQAKCPDQVQSQASKPWWKFW